jgi:hypothetical protein
MSQESNEEFTNWSDPLPYLKHSMNNRHLLKEEGGRCIFCTINVKFSKIEEWLDEQKTAICPHCGIDAVVPMSVLPHEKEESEKLILKWRKLGFGQAAT